MDGLIAIILGRLRMRVERCIDTIETLSQEIFKLDDVEQGF